MTYSERCSQFLGHAGVGHAPLFEINFRLVVLCQIVLLPICDIMREFFWWTL